MSSTYKVISIALVAGALGLIASIALNQPAVLMRSEWGQRVLQAVAQSPATNAHPIRSLQRGERLSALTLPDLTGTPISLPAAFQGQELLINLWASWCAPCLEEMPELDRYARLKPADGVQVVGIALDNPAQVGDFLRRVTVHYPILIDSTGTPNTSIRLGNPTGVLPYSVLIGSDGIVLKQRIGPFAADEIDDWANAAEQ